jgi:hypothetical protein
MVFNATFNNCIGGGSWSTRRKPPTSTMTVNKAFDRVFFCDETTYVISAYHHYRCEFEPRSGEVYSIQHYVIKFVSDFYIGNNDNIRNNFD